MEDFFHILDETYFYRALILSPYYIFETLTRTPCVLLCKVANEV